MRPAIKPCARPRDCDGWHCHCGRHLVSVNVCPAGPQERERQAAQLRAAVRVAIAHLEHGETVCAQGEVLRALKDALRGSHRREDECGVFHFCVACEAPVDKPGPCGDCEVR